MKKSEQKLNELRNAVSAYNELRLNPKATVKALEKREKECEELKKEYNSLSQIEALKACAETEQPLITAVTVLYYPIVSLKLAAVDKESTDLHLEVRESRKPINIDRLHQRTKGGIGIEKDWWAYIELLNEEMTAEVAESLNAGAGAEVRSDFKKRKAEGVKFKGKVASSEKAILNSLQVIINKMIGDKYKVTMSDVRFLLYGHTKADNKDVLGTKTINNGAMFTRIMGICHHLVTGNPYPQVSYKKSDKK